MNIFLAKNLNPLMNASETHALPFAFDKRFKFVSCHENAEAVPLLYTHSVADQERQVIYFQKCFPKKTLAIVLNVFNDCEDDDISRMAVYKKYFENCVLFSTAYNKPCKHTEFYDMLWNRTKAAYSLGYVDRNILNESVYLKGFGLDIFQLDHDKNIEYNILCPNRRYTTTEMPKVNRLRYRNLVYEFLKGKPSTLMSDPDNDEIFQTSNWKPYYQNLLKTGGNYAPIDPKYYNKSLVSCYIESVAVNKLDGGGKQINKTITEKTWEPMLKGHFILPFASSGIIKELSRRTFKFPDFIDYSYTELEDDNKRFTEFLSLTESIRKMPISESKKVYERNIDVMTHNIDLFKILPYDCLHSKLEKHLSI